MHRRRTAFAAIATLMVTVPWLTSKAQESVKTPRIGVLVNGSAANNAAVEAMRQGLGSLGYVEGKSVILEARYAEGKLERLPAFAAELAGLEVDVIATFGGPASNAAIQATKTIPIVFAIVADPVAVGFAVTMERPGRNATGITNNDPEQARLQMELLKELLPKLVRVVILSDQDIPGADASGLAPIERSAVAAARALGLQPKVLKLRGPSPDLEAAFKAVGDENAEALLVLEVPVTLAHRKRIGQLAITQRIPSMFSAGSSDAGGVASYGTNVADTWPRVPSFIDQILKGAKPGDLPVEIITRREFSLSVKTARDLGLIIPVEVLKRADRVID